MISGRCHIFPLMKKTVTFSHFSEVLHHHTSLDFPSGCVWSQEFSVCPRWFQSQHRSPTFGNIQWVPNYFDLPSKKEGFSIAMFGYRRVLGICYGISYLPSGYLLHSHGKSTHFWVRSTIYFYGPSIPWLCNKQPEGTGKPWFLAGEIHVFQMFLAILPSNQMGEGWSGAFWPSLLVSCCFMRNGFPGGKNGDAVATSLKYQ